MASIATLAVQLTAITAPFSRGMKAATAPVRAFGSVIDSANARVAGFVGGLIGAAAIGAGARFVKTQMDAADALGKTSDQLGVNVQKLKAYEIGARKSGLEQSALVSGLSKFGTLLSKSGMGLDVDTGLRVVADEIMSLSNETDRLRASTQLFGNSAGRQFLSFLEGGSDGLDAMISDAERLGATLDRTDISEIEAANDAWEDISITLENVAAVVGVKVSPFITDMSTRLAEATANGVEFGSTVTDGLRFVAKGVGYIMDGWKVLNIVIKMGQQLVLGFVELTVKAFNQSIKGVNLLSKQLNKVLPKSMQIPEIGQLDAMIQGLEDSIFDIQDDIREIIDGGWESSKVDDYFDTIIEKSREAAEARVADNDLIGESIDAVQKKGDDQKFAQATQIGVLNYLRNVAAGTQVNGTRLTGPGGARVQTVSDPQLAMTNRLLGQIADNTESSVAVAG